MPGVDRPQRLGPRRHPDRDVRVHGRRAALPPQPGARPALHHVPRPARRHAAPPDAAHASTSRSGSPRRRDEDVVLPRGHRGGHRCGPSGTRPWSSPRRPTSSIPPRTLAHVLDPACRAVTPRAATTCSAPATAFACFADPPAYDDIAAARARRRRAVVRHRPAVRVRRAGRRRRPATTAAGLGGVGRRRVDVAARSTATGPAGSTGPATWSSTCRRRTPASVIARPARRLAALPGRPGARGLPVLQRQSPTMQRGQRVHASAAPCGAVHAETVTDEVLGLSEGVPGQAFPLARGPVVVGRHAVRRRGRAGGRAGSGGPRSTPSPAATRTTGLPRRPGDRGGAVRPGRARARRHAALLRRGAAEGRTDAGARSTAPAAAPRATWRRGAVQVLRTTVPFVDRVENRRAATGGVAAETVDEAKLRGPLALRTRDRAVTAEDYEQLARDAAPRHRPRAVRAAAEHGRGRAACGCSWSPSASTGRRGPAPVRGPGAVAGDARGRRRATSTSAGPSARGWSSSRRSTRASRSSRRSSRGPRTAVRRAAARRPCTALNRYFDPLTGGPDGTGWPFGRPVQAGEVYAVLQQLPGTELVEDVVLFACRPGHRQARGRRCSGSTSDRLRPGVLLRPPDPGDPR